MKFGKKDLKAAESAPISFAKMHGLRNDFVIIENLDKHLRLSKEQIIRLCDRRDGIGADGLILLEKEAQCAAQMRYYNSDGGAAQVCGNGLRCAAKYLFDRGIAPGAQFEILCNGQRYGAEIVEKDTNGRVALIDIQMGCVRFGLPESEEEAEPQEHTIAVGAKRIIFYAAEMPNPHAIVFVERIKKEMLVEIAAAFKSDARYPEGVNVSLAEPFNAKEVKAITLERGSGITDACGSAACAIGAAMYKKGLCGENIAVFMPGGKLEITLNMQGEKTSCAMCAPAQSVYTGEIRL